MTKLKSIILGVALIIVAAVSVGCTLSAYDVAVQNGYQGTEQEWLDTLKGNNGSDGSDITADSLYQKALDEGFEGTYLEFLKEYLSVSEASDNSAAITKGLRSAILVQCRFTQSSNSLFGSSNGFAQAGAGVIYKINKSEGSAHILTNYHVVYSSNSSVSTHVSNNISILPYGGNEVKATYIGGNSTYDIAVLYVQDDYFKGDFPEAVTYASSDDVVVGQTAIAIGNPAGKGISATQGIVSVDSENITMQDIENSSAVVTMRVMRIDAAVNSGNSGGGLFDNNGNFIGVVSAKASDSDIENMGYAIPSTIATAVADKIIKNGKFSKGTLGISVNVSSSSAYLDGDKIRKRETVSVVAVDGASKGIIEVGDVILSIDVAGKGETSVTRQYIVTDSMLSSNPGDKITLKINRAGEEKTVEVTCS